MKALFDQISLSCSKNITNTYSTSFSLAVRMLSTSIQAPIHAIYGFVRLADEIVDSFHDYDKEALLNEFTDDLSKALDRKISLNPVLNSFQDTVHTYNIDRELIDAFLDSMRRDLFESSCETIEAYNTYIYGSADVVGLMCLNVFVNGDKKEYERLKPYAMKLGSAFQKVNFLRDLKDDVQVLNRNYFPHLEENTLNAATKKIILQDIEHDFEQAYIGVQMLPKNARFGVYTAYIYYKQLLMKLKNTKSEKILTARIRVSNPEKIGLLAKSFLNYKLNTLGT